MDSRVFSRFFSSNLIHLLIKNWTQNSESKYLSSPTQQIPLGQIPDPVVVSWRHSHFWQYWSHLGLILPQHSPLSKLYSAELQASSQYPLFWGQLSCCLHLQTLQYKSDSGTILRENKLIAYGANFVTITLLKHQSLTLLDLTYILSAWEPAGGPFCHTLL